MLTLEGIFLASPPSDQTQVSGHGGRNSQRRPHCPSSVFLPTRTRPMPSIGCPGNQLYSLRLKKKINLSYCPSPRRGAIGAT